jgi:hypothetical protein
MLRQEKLALLRSYALCCAALLLAAVSNAVAEPCSFPITGLSQASAALVSLELPLSALADLGGRSELLRIYDVQQRETPYLCVPMTSKSMVSQREKCPSKVLIVREKSGGGVLLEFELLDGSPQPSGVTIDTPLRRFEQLVTLSGEIDGTWQVLVPEALIFESSGLLAMRHNELRFPLSVSRRFRLEISKVSIERQAELRQVTRMSDADGAVSTVEKTVLRDEPFQIGAVSFWRERSLAVDTAVKNGSYAVKELNHEWQADKKRSVYTLTPECYPVCGVEIISPERNYQRRVRILREEGSSMQEWHIGVVSAIRLPGFQKMSNGLNFAEISSGELQLIIDEHDNPPLEVSEIRLRTPLQQLLFFAEPQRVPYALTALAKGGAPVYGQHAVIRDAWASGAALQPAGLGARQGTPMELAAPGGTKVPRWALMVVLLLAVAALAFGVVKAAQSAQGMETPP